MDPRLAVLAVLSTAFAEGIPEIEKRVGVLRVEPIWADEELPIVLLDFDGERREIRTVAPRDYEHALTLNVLVYVKGESDKNRVDLLGIMDGVETIMREWQFITAGDVDPDSLDPDEVIVSDIRGGNAIDYFVSPNGDQEHMAARISYEAIFYTSGSSDGTGRPGAPARNRLRDFMAMLVNWLARRRGRPAGDAQDTYPLEHGDQNDPTEKNYG